MSDICAPWAGVDVFVGKKRARKAEGRAALQRVDARRGVMVRRDVSGVGLSSPEL